jgi:hypothetical protein
VGSHPQENRLGSRVRANRRSSVTNHFETHPLNTVSGLTLLCATETHVALLCSGS